LEVVTEGLPLLLYLYANTASSLVWFNGAETSEQETEGAVNNFQCFFIVVSLLFLLPNTKSCVTSVVVALRQNHLRKPIRNRVIFCGGKVNPIFWSQEPIFWPVTDNRDCVGKALACRLCRSPMLFSNAAHKFSLWSLNKRLVVHKKEGRVLPRPSTLGILPTSPSTAARESTRQIA
jgi:hypothetical protein